MTGPRERERERERERDMSRIPTEALPREILAVLPQEPYDQLDLAHRINAYAYTQKVSEEGFHARYR